MFTVGIFTDYLYQDFEKAAYTVANEFKLRQVELRTMWNKNIVDLSDEELNKVDRIIRKEDLSVCCLGSPFLKCKLTEDAKVDAEDAFFAEAESYEKHLDILDRSIQLARRFNTNLVRCFAFWRQELTPSLWQEMIDKIREAVKVVEKNNIVLVLENCPGVNITTAKEASKLLKEINSPHLRLLWDPDNCIPPGEIPYPDGYCLIKDYVEHVHVKDSIWNRELDKPEHVPVGEGEVNWEGQFKALLNYNYQGVVSLENLYVPEGGDKAAGTTHAFRNLKRMLVSMGVCVE